MWHGGRRAWIELSLASEGRSVESNVLGLYSEEMIGPSMRDHD
jgi:hypothetical protein